MYTLTLSLLLLLQILKYVKHRRRTLWTPPVNATFIPIYGGGWGGFPGWGWGGVTGNIGRGLYDSLDEVLEQLTTSLHNIDYQ